MKAIPNLKSFFSLFLVLIGMHVAIMEYLPDAYKQYLIHIGIKPGYDAKKGVIFTKQHLN